ncbi:MAG: ethanolamine ammonia-lyase subunit EutC [Oscillospiraceae bacterium]|nr:ethanolamine ammonia-lyase subunit EutC [Oscillospiraceae bacterium]
MQDALVELIVQAILEAQSNTNKPAQVTPTQEHRAPQPAQVTSARIGVGCAGTRLRTDTYLQFRADHAAARDAVYNDVPAELLQQLNLPEFATQCQSRDEFLTRPDLGRVFSEQTGNAIAAHNASPCDVLVYAADGLSSKAIAANLENILPVITESLTQQGLSCGKPFFVKYGRVASMEQVAQLTGAKVVCVLIGERPGLGSAESMSAYMAYAPTPGMPEARRTVVSNIYSGGLNAVEAGAYVAEVLGRMHREKKSGVELNEG